MTNIFEGIKFFEESVCLFRDGATAIATSNSTNAKEVLTNDRRIKWQSSGSDDTITENIDITLPSTDTFSRIYIGENNFKEYELQYNDTGTWKYIIPTKIVDGVEEAEEILTNNTIVNLGFWDILLGTYALSSDVPSDTLPNSIHWQNPAKYGNLRQVSPRFTTETDQTYRVVVYLKGTAGSDMQVWIRKGDDSGWLITPIFQITADWQKYEFLLTETAGGNLAYFTLTAREVAGIADVYMALPSVKEYEYEEINTIYAEFEEITTDEIRIVAKTTQVADEEKETSCVLAMEEIGQFNLFPDIKSVNIDRNESKKKVLSEKYLVQKNFKTRSFSLGFSKHFDQYNMDLKALLFDREYPFYVWLCAGKFGEKYYKPTAEPHRLQDLITMQTSGNAGNLYGNNFYKGGINTSVKLIEVVG